MSAPRRTDRGIALIMALLTLFVLTLLGLALAAGTATEVQIAANHRWSRQAVYNAKAGLAVGRRLLRDLEWSDVLPVPRSTGWTLTSPGSPPPPPVPMRDDEWGNPRRDWERGGCDLRGGHVGYGTVLDDGNPIGPYQAKSTIFGHALAGAFTIWVRRPLVTQNNGVIADDDASSDTVIMTVEGVAPFTGDSAELPMARASAATHVLEVVLSRNPSNDPTRCGVRSGQAGGGADGSNLARCDPVGEGADVLVALGGAATGTGSDLTSAP